ncbi:MAG: MarR family transcriptional regulator [Bacteroidia bacterium]
MKLMETVDQALALEKLEKSLSDMSDVYRKHRQYIKTKHQISSLEMEIIQLVIRDGMKKMKEIGQHFNIKLSTLTSIIDKIEEQNLVRRTNSRDDRRVVYLEATRKGQKVFDEYNQYIQAMSLFMSNSLNPDQIQAFMDGIDQISGFLSGQQEV